ncbi:heterokaryon incompatibility protein-domain-containing protein [Podospora aff. communis PSN243]|uniref:Heterokaryon incompatibility protein-domain-containing protein n=1 Tax=Podospora aff. communis PSN243 TaxID=3040156 RepID=A0AAV9G645_9PEZI|nr:heterokaryon incompatibility protein-domain-containing protein [Podospora aff. communis PSN243]
MSQTQRTSFNFARPLKKEKCEIRLLRLESLSSLRGTLKGTIEHVSLNDNPVYHALSYTWEGSSPINITDNLSAALRYFGASSKPSSHLWVDAVCINQADDAEKSWQIGQMHRVYSQAETTIIWLGPPSVHSTLAIELLVSARRFARKTQAYKIPRNSMLPPIPRANNQQEFQDLQMAASFGRLFQKPVENLSSQGIPEYPMEAIADLFGREWWGRVWVLQELVFAKKAVFVCGRDWIDTEAEGVFGTFLHTWDVLAKELGRQPALLDHRPWFMINRRLEDEAVSGNLRTRSKPLAKLLKEAYTASLMASDPRDHIYALLGLAQDAAELNIEIDYFIPHHHLYVKVAKKYLARGDLWFLPFCQNNGVSKTALPSWAPDWSRSGGKLEPLKQLGYAVLEENRTKRVTKATFSISTLTNRQCVHLDGAIVDSVEWVSPDRPLARQDLIQDPHIRGAVIRWMRESSLAIHRSHETVFDEDGERTSDIVSATAWALLADSVPLPKEDLDTPMYQQHRAIWHTFQRLLDPLLKWPHEEQRLQQRAEAFLHCMIGITDREGCFTQGLDTLALGMGKWKRGM